MKAVIMAAGDGKRLRPFTETRPKVMLPIAGIPILQRLIEQIKKVGIRELFIIVKYQKESIIEYFSKKKSEKSGIKLTFIEQGEDTGTAAALMVAEGKISGKFLLMAGDGIVDAKILKDVIDSHVDGITVALKKVENPTHYGIASVTKNKITRFEEKSTKPQSNLANISIYVMDDKVFPKLKNLKKSPRGDYEITDLLVGERAVIVDGYWKDIGHPWDMLDANAELLARMEAQQEHMENSTINGKVILVRGAKILNSYIEGDVYIGKNSIIGPNAYIRGPVSIGANCQIGPGTIVKNSILFDNVNAKHLTYIGDSVIGENVNFGAGTQIANYRFDGSVVNVLTEKGWANSGRKKLGVFVGDNTRFGVLSCVMPGKLIGNNCWIYSGAIINKNVPPNTRVQIKHELEFYDNKTTTTTITR